MKRIKLALNFKGLDHSGKVVAANTIYIAMNANVNYPSLSTLVTNLGIATTDLDNVIKAEHPNVIVIKSKEIYLEKLLIAIKANVELLCNDDESIAVSSGFALVQNSTPKPKVFNATQGVLPGTVDLECPFANLRAAYVWEIISDPISVNTWQQLKITNTTATQIIGLVSGQKYWFRVKAIVKDQEQAYTDPHMVHVI